MPAHPIRVALGFLLMLFSPGYILLCALFPSMQKTSNLEKVALSIGMSIAIVSLLGLGLNYTPWGVSINTVLYTVSVFILLTSGLALIRQSVTNKGIRFTMEFKFNLLNENAGKLSNSLTLLVFMSLLITIGMLGYTIAAPKIGEKFSEFYILGYGGEAQNYPSVFFYAKRESCERFIW